MARKAADDSVLDRYERQRRHVAVAHTQAQTIRNKRLLAEQDPAVRRRTHDELRRTAENPDLARQFLLRTALRPVSTHTSAGSIHSCAGPLKLRSRQRGQEKTALS